MSVISIFITLIVIVVFIAIFLCIGYFSAGRHLVWLGRKIKANILRIEEVHHEHDENEECCGPGMGYRLISASPDNDKTLFEKYIGLQEEKIRLESKKQITVYVDRRNPKRYFVDLKSAQ